MEHADMYLFDSLIPEINQRSFNCAFKLSRTVTGLYAIWAILKLQGYIKEQIKKEILVG